MQGKSLSVNLIANIFSYAIATFLSFLITPYIVNHLGKEIYGFYGIANNFVNYITVIAIALNSMAAKYITVEVVRGNEIKAQQYYSSIFFSNVILCLILIPMLIFIVFKLNVLLQVANDYYFGVQVLFALIFMAMILRFSTSIYGTATYVTNRLDLKAYTDIAKSVLRLCLYLMLFVVLQPSIIYLGIILFLIEAFNSLIQVILSKRLLPWMSVRTAYFDVKLVLLTLKIGTWNSLNQLGDLMLSSSSLIMANILLGEAASGDISIVKVMPVLISGIITAVNSVFMPRVAITYAKNNVEKLVEEVKQAQKIMGMIIIPVVMLLIVFGEDFYKLWVPETDSVLLAKLSAIDVSRMILIAVVWPVSNLNIVLDKVKIPSILVLLSGILNILIMILLTKVTNIGIFSIVISTLILTILFYGVFIPMYPCRNLKIKSSAFMEPLVKMFGTVAIVGCVIVPLHNNFIINNWIDFFLKGFVCAIPAYLISVLVFMDLGKIFNLVKRKR